MGKALKRADRRRRIGRVSVYRHARRWWVYYRENGRRVRKSVADDTKAAEQVAAQTILELAAIIVHNSSSVQITSYKVEAIGRQWNFFWLRSGTGAAKSGENAGSGKVLVDIACRPH
jgi:hypothetical protein